jgi:uncharacterized membrane protein
MEKLFLPGIVILIIAILFKIFPPKKANWIYGYRTSSAMKNQETWNEANKYSANLLLLSGFVTLIAGIMCYYYPNKNSINLVATSFVVMVIITISMTEIHLKKTFNKEGNRK